VVRKPIKSRKAKAQHKSKMSQAHTKRKAAKHRARKLSARWAWVQRSLVKAFAKTVTVPKMDVEVPLVPALAFVAVLGFAVGAGYWGARSLFGETPPVATQPAAPVVIQQTHGLNGVILADPNGGPPHEARVYEEKALVEVYEPSLDVERGGMPAQTSPEMAVASVTPPVAQSPHAGPQPLWMQNALAFASAPANAPRLAIVIDDMGVDRKRSKRMWEDVPGPLTMSFMTYADDLPDQTAAARAMGHELMLHMSMEPSNVRIDAGPNVLLTAMPSPEIRSIANWGMDRFKGFIGVNNHMGSRFTEDERGMRVVLEEIKKRGLVYLDSRTSNRTVGPKIARQLGVPALERNVFLDNDNIPEKVLKQLGEAERLARKHGRAIAIGHPRDATIEVLKTWVPKARERGLVIVPISVLMQEKLKSFVVKR